MSLNVTERFDPQAMQAFMRLPELYWGGRDALDPPPEAVDFVGFMLQPNVWTLAATWDDHVVGFVQVVQRTSIGGEMHCAFHANLPQRAKVMVGRFAIEMAFGPKGFLKLWAPIPVDHRPAIWAARLIGFMPEGRLRKAIVRPSPVGLTDLLIMGLSKENWSH